MSASRSSIAALIDRVRDHLLIAKNALQEDDIEKAATSIENASKDIASAALGLHKDNESSSSGEEASLGSITNGG